MLLVVIIMFCIDLWGFSIDPPYFGYNSTEQENPLLCILTLQGPSREPSRAQEVNKGGHEAQTRPGGTGSWPGRAT
jgi:hypothetical protein